MRIFAIDPGNARSAYVGWDTDTEGILCKGIDDNWDILCMMHNKALAYDYDILAVEMVASYGMPVGATVFDTCVWIGRFLELWEIEAMSAPSETSLVYRKDVKMNLCKTMRAKDGNVRQALIDRFGEPGTKKNPGKLYGVKKDIWSALAIAVTYADTSKSNDHKK